MEITITDKNYETQVKNSTVPMILDFWATWCGPCKMIAPELETLDGQLNGSVNVGKVNVDEQAELASAFGIEVIPTLVLMKDGKEVKRFSGYRTAQEIKRELGL